MTKADLIEALTKKCDGLSKREANDILDTVFETLAKSIKKDKRFTFPGFGTWTLRKRSSRKGRNPQTGATITIPAHHTVTFKPSAEWKKSLK